MLKKKNNRLHTCGLTAVGLFQKLFLQQSHMYIEQCDTSATGG